MNQTTTTTSAHTTATTTIGSLTCYQWDGWSTARRRYWRHLFRVGRNAGRCRESAAAAATYCVGHTMTGREAESYCS